MALTELPLSDRRRRLAEARQATKDSALFAVKCYMERLRVSLEELVQDSEEKERRWEQAAKKRAMA
jgi:hypothetical protein